MEIQAFRDKTQVIILKQEGRIMEKANFKKERRSAEASNFAWILSALANRAYSSPDLINQRPASIQGRRLQLSIQRDQVSDGTERLHCWCPFF